MSKEKDFEQMELDTRPQLLVAVQDLAEESVREALGMVQENLRRTAAVIGTTPAKVRNRHEAYGIAAEQYTRISKAVSAIKGDVAALLGTLGDPNHNAVEATSSIVNSATEAAAVLLHAAAEMRRALDDLYTAEYTEPGPTPLDELAGANFQDADPVEGDDNDETEE